MRSRRSMAAGVAALVLGLALSFFSALAQTGTAQSIRYGEIVSIERAVIEKPPKSGAVGATVGAVAGYALAGGRDRWLGSILGGVIGGAAGKRVGTKQKGWELVVRIEGGEEIGMQLPGKKQEFEAGDRVRLMTGPGGQTKLTRVES